MRQKQFNNVNQIKLNRSKLQLNIKSQQQKILKFYSLLELQNLAVIFEQVNQQIDFLDTQSETTNKMRSRLRSQSKKKHKEKGMAKNTVKKEEKKKSPQRKSSNKKDDDQNTKTITSGFSITKQITQKKQQQKQKSQAKKQEKSYEKKEQSRSISHKRKISSQLSYSKPKKKQTTNKRQLKSNKSEKSRQDGDLMIDIEDIIEKQLKIQEKQQKRAKNVHFRTTTQQSFRSKPSNQEIVQTIFFPKKHKNIEGKSTHEELIIQGIMRIDRDLKKRKQKNKNNNMKKLNRKVNMKVEKLKNEVDKEIINGGIIPWLLPEWGLQKLGKNKSIDIRQWMRKGLGFNYEQEGSEGEERRQQSPHDEQDHQRKPQPHLNNSLQDDSLPIAQPSNPQQQNIYYERAIINQNFQQYYNTGMKFLYEHLPKRLITLSEFQSYDDFVKSNFIIVYFLSRFYYKNFDKTKTYFTDSAQFDKYYTQDLMDCFQYIFPEVKQIVENQWRQKFQQGWDEYDENIGVRAYEQRRIDKMRKDRSRIKQSRKNEVQQIRQQQVQDMITEKDWLEIFHKVYKSTDRQQVNDDQRNEQQEQHSISPSEPKQILYHQQQIQIIESNNFITNSINDQQNHNFESPTRKGPQKRIYIQEQQQSNQLQDLDDYYHQISTIIKSKRKQNYNNSNSNNKISNTRRQKLSTTQFRKKYQYQQLNYNQQQDRKQQNQQQQMAVKPNKRRHKKTNKRLNKSMIQLRPKINLDSDSDTDTQQHIQGIDQAFLLEDEQDNQL